MKIYHNPRCKKSRSGLAYLTDHGIQPDIRLYLDDNLSVDELKELLKLLKTPASELVRTQEEYYKKELKGKNLSEDEWISVLVENPKLIKRPIVSDGKKAVLGDPAENIRAML